MPFLRTLSALIAALLMSTPGATAQEVRMIGMDENRVARGDAIIFRRDVLSIIPQAQQIEEQSAPKEVPSETASESDDTPKEEVTSAENANTDTEDIPAEPVIREPRDYQVKIKSEGNIAPDGFFQLTKILEGNAVLFIFAGDKKHGLSPTSLYFAMDFMFVSAEGKIQQIIPNLALAELGAPITPRQPIRAILALPAGDTVKYGFHPGDQVKHPLFQAGPLIIQ